MANTLIDRILRAFPKAHRNGRGWIARCPAHDDKEPSLSIAEGDDGRVLIHCHAGCSVDEIVEKVGLEMRDLFPQSEKMIGEREYISDESAATAQPLSSDSGCTLAQYAEAKHLPVDFLINLGLKDIHYNNHPAVRMPYLDERGDEGPVRFRIRLKKAEDGDGRFKWRKGSKPTVYGLWRLDAARKAGYAIRVEGESDCHAAWFHGLPTFGIPGASMWRDEWAKYFDGIPIIYDVVEDDKGGEAWLKALAESKLRDRVRLVRLEDVKDICELHCADPESFLERWEKARENSIAWTDYAHAEARKQADEAWHRCKSLATRPRILDAFAEAIEMSGVVGESKNSKILYLAMTSRFLNRPVSLAVKGPSSGGKSFITERVLYFFPECAYYALTAMSERALAYSDEPLSHRFLVVYEAAGLRGDFATYLIRSLLSEGRVRYETVEKTSKGIRPRLIEREGPTGLIVTTTSVSLHAENETRMLSLSVTDTPDQTRNILLAIAGETSRRPNVEEWHSLQIWLESSEHHVIVPYSKELASKIPPVSTRLRRDFTALLNLISAHAILHQAQRKRDEDRRIIASLEDYRVVRDLVADLFAEGVDATISATLRETVGAVRELTENEDTTNNAAVARMLKLDKGTALRRVQAAIAKGFVRNLEDRKGRPARLVCGEPMPDDIRILPLPEELSDCADVYQHDGNAIAQRQDNTDVQSDGCRVAELTEGNGLPPFPSPVKCSECGAEFMPESENEIKSEPICIDCEAIMAAFSDKDVA